MVTPKVKKRIGSYVYEVYEEKNLKGIFYNVKVYYDGRYVQTIPYLNFEKPQLLSDVETDVKNKIFTGINDPIQSKPLPPPPPTTPIEDLPLEPQNKEKPKSEGKIIDNNSNQPIKGAQIEVTKTPSTIAPSSTPPPITTSNNKGEFNLELSTLSGSNKKQISFYSYTISQETSQSDIIVKIYYNNELIPGEGLYGGTQSFFYNYTYIPPTDNGPIQSFDGILGVEKWILFQFELHNISPRFYNSDKKEYYPPIDIPNKSENISPDSTLLENNNSSSLKPTNEPPKTVISAPGYETKEIPLTKGDGTVKEDLGVIQMTPIKTATEADKIEASQLKPDQINKLSDSKKTPEYFAQKKLTDLVINLKGTALPLAITLISQFGITKVAQLIDQGKTKSTDLKDKISCPTPTELDKLISRKNKLVKQINNSLKIIDNTTKILGITEGVLLTLDIAYKLLKNLPIPSSVPPGIGLPVNAILGVQDSKDTISKVITKLKTANTGLLTILVIVRQVLIQLLQYLSLLDTLIQQCSPNNELNQEQLSAELTALTQQQSENSPIVTNVNGFEMGVETEATTNSLKRRRAIARNKGGVVMLKGEWSFSSIDQILIDELVFYIQQNDLKAD